MAGFEDTSLWQSSLGKQIDQDNDEKERDVFRVNLESFREKAAMLSGEIARSLPEYTVHDSSHTDALWEMANIICGEDYKLNPAEAFVLGGAFLIHDLGMGLAAYPEGIDSLKKLVIWTDTESYLSKTNGYDAGELEKKVLEIVLRKLHAVHAEKLAFASWGTTKKEFLIDNAFLREGYGAIIGKIAHSHWWDSSELVNKFQSKLGAIGSMPNTWDVDPLKLACIMRVADASHIDSRRAPAFLMKVRNLSRYSEQHWKFQEKLYQPRLEREKLAYTAKSSFTIDESASWWLCFDTVQMIDKELHAVDNILQATNKQRLKAKGVIGVGDLNSLSRLISTEGWNPIDTRIHVGNVSKLVKNLGGSQLYGRDLFVPLRELIQNGCDAIRARRKLENESDTYGLLTVTINKDSNGIFFEVEDDGVGMSERVLTGPFLDFGNSFWGTPLMHEELPGLESKGYESTGKFGVGFFSVFMLGGKVNVTTRRYEDARQDTKVLSFEKDLIERPLLRNANSDEYIRNGGTRVRVYINDSESLEEILKVTYYAKYNDFAHFLKNKFPTSDVEILVKDYINNVQKTAVEANDWITLKHSDFVERVILDETIVDKNAPGYNSPEDVRRFSENLSCIIDDGVVLGRAFLNPNSSRFEFVGDTTLGSVTIGGCKTVSTNGVVGFLLGNTNKASRDSATPIASSTAFKNWLTEQTKMLIGNISPIQEINLSAMLRSVSLDVGDLCIAKGSEGAINKKTLEEEYFGKHNEILIAYDLELDSHNIGSFDYSIEYSKNVISVSTSMFYFLEHSRTSHLSWLGDLDNELHENNLLGLIYEIASEVWGVPLKRIIEVQEAKEIEHYRERRVIGRINNIDYYSGVIVLNKEGF